jgi:hypothetical protein
MGREVDRPPTRAELNRLLVVNALTKPVPNVVVPAAVAVIGIAFGIPLIGIGVAVLAWVALAATTYFDGDEAERVAGAQRARRRAKVEKRSPRLNPATLSLPVREHLMEVLEQEQRIREAIERAELPFEEVSGEVDGFVRVAERTASRAELLFEYLDDQDPARTSARLEQVKAQVAAGDSSKAPLVEALTAQKQALDLAREKLDDFFTEMERVSIELGNIRGQLLSVSAATESASQRELAAGVRDLREQIGAVAEGMSEVLDTTGTAPSPPGAAPAA